jgi:hypothetical protein
LLNIQLIYYYVIPFLDIYITLIIKSDIVINFLKTEDTLLASLQLHKYCRIYLKLAATTIMSSQYLEWSYRQSVFMWNAVHNYPLTKHGHEHIQQDNFVGNHNSICCDKCFKYWMRNMKKPIQKWTHTEHLRPSKEKKYFKGRTEEAS